MEVTGFNNLCLMNFIVEPLRNTVGMKCCWYKLLKNNYGDLGEVPVINHSGTKRLRLSYKGLSFRSSKLFECL